jgi:hypothetical protein
MAMTKMAPRSSAMARVNRNSRALVGTRGPAAARTATAKAMSVAIGIPQPCAAGPPALKAA